MKFSACLVLAVFVLCAIYSQANALPQDESTISNCRGQNDRRCPQAQCGINRLAGWRPQDNTKPYPQCCGGPICRDLN